MAPRGRPRQRTSPRMVPAVEMMTKDYGFSEEVTRKVINELLNVYGEEGWYFIEGNGYKELVEAILRDQETNSQMDPKELVNSDEGDSSQRGTSATDAGVAAEPTHSVLVENELEKQPREGNDRLPLTEGNERGWKDIGLDQFSGQREIANALHENSGSNEVGEISSMLFPPPKIPPTPLACSVPRRPESSSALSPPFPPPPSGSVPVRRRRPCYGWIDSDEEEEPDDFIELTPAVETVDSWGKMSSGMEEQLKCRSSLRGEFLR